MNISLLTWQAKYVFDGLQKYAETLERLLVAETARVLTHETLSVISAKSRELSLEPEDPSDGFVRLRDSFPMILRGSLLPYIHGNFERFARSIANLYLSEKPIPKSNTNEITTRVNAAWPSTFSEETTLRLANYMHLRHACAHTAGRVGRDLYEPKRVAKAAQDIPGATFRSLATPGPELTKIQRWSGYIEFDASFLPEAITFHASQIERIANVVVPKRNSHPGGQPGYAIDLGSTGSSTGSCRNRPSRPVELGRFKLEVPIHCRLNRELCLMQHPRHTQDKFWNRRIEAKTVLSHHLVASLH